jgi:hypothetical protein
MAQTRGFNAAQPNPTLVVTGTGSGGAKTVEELMNDSFSPLTYRDRAKKYFPVKQEPDAIEHYFVSSIPSRAWLNGFKRRNITD